MFKNKVLRRIFGSERDEVMAGWRKLHSEELYIIVCTLYQILLGFSNEGD
jgi:hypothetical protein